MKGESEAAPQVASAEEQGEAASLGEDYGRISAVPVGCRLPADLSAADATDFAQGPAEEESIKRRKREGRLKPQRSANSAATTPSVANARKYQDQDFPDVTNPTNRPFNPWSVVRLKYGRPMGEFLGVMVFIFLGISCNLSITVSQNQAGNLNTEYFCWGFSAMLGIYISGGSSGAFLNPVLVIMLSVFRGFPAKRLPSYIFAQCLGAFVGTLLALAVYHDSIINMDGALLSESTGLSIYTQPRGAYIRASTAFFTELLGSAILCCTILALGDSGNSPPGAGMHALIIGLLITTCTMSLSWTTRGCFNPARDFGPRLAAIAFGYPLESFTAWHNWWIWGGWIAPITGGLVGGLAYDLCVFKGGESPVNFSWGTWKKRGLRKEQLLLWNVFGKKRKAEAIGRKLESGRLDTKEERNSVQA